MWFLVMLTFYDTDRKTVKERSRSRVCINSKEHENVKSFRMHITTFLVIKEQDHSLGVPDFELKIFRLQINNGKGKTYLIQTQAQLDLERASLIGSCGEPNNEFLWNAGRFSPDFLSWVVSSKFRGWVVSDLVGWSFRPIFRVSVVLAKV